ncbi:MAG: amidase domain-containing protein [Oscillospiraceae bacterium]|jgi:hypothetical protein|nr:amidase domain-containing protein [Oscillospiraceae bacterium]
MGYNRQAAVNYAKRWWNGRNPEYYDFQQLGGDCTNFISQCLYAGYGEMNRSEWYYYALNSRSPSWTGVEFLHDFLVRNRGAGPRASERPLPMAQIGDIVQLSFDGDMFSHSLLVVDKSPTDTLIAAHTYDSYARSLRTYYFQKARLLAIAD